MKTLRTFALAAGLLAVGMAGPTPARAQAQLTGTTTALNAGPGDQISPAVDCNLASYTDDQGISQRVRYFDFTTSTEQAVPNSALSFLSDVSANRIAFTQVSSAGSEIRVFEATTNTILTVPGGTQRTNPSIGGTLVAFEDRSFSANPNESEILVYDLATNTTSRLTADALMDTNPAVSPTGNAVVFQKCQTNGAGCNIYVATQIAPGVFSTTLLPGQTGENFNPATNGSVVVYTATRNLETHVYYQPIAGGAETQLPLTGTQRNPSVSGNLIAFDSQQVTGDFGVFVYDIASGTVYRATNTPAGPSWNGPDISVCGSTARIVYSAPGANGDFDVFAFTFTPPAASVPFASFTAAVAFDRGPRANDDELRMGGVFTLGGGSNGVNPLTEEVALQVGSFSATIPAGAFRRDRFGLLRFDGSIGGHHVLVILTPLGGGRYAVVAEVETLELPGTRTPVTVALRIGNDAGSVTVTPLID
jgi:hypothetical protein